MIELKYKERAIELALNQGELANSPVEQDSHGDIKMCAAACLAYAAVEDKEGEHIAQKFVKKLARNNNKNDVVEIFKKFGWGKLFCEFIMVENDNASNSSRIEVFKINLGLI